MAKFNYQNYEDEDFQPKKKPGKSKVKDSWAQDRKPSKVKKFRYKNL